MSWDGTIEVGKPYVSRDGREIRIYATDGYGDQPIHGAMPVDRGETSWLSHTWTSGGCFYAAEQLESDYDIVGLWADPPEPKWRPFAEDEFLRVIGRIVRQTNGGNAYALVTGVIGGRFVIDGTPRSREQFFEFFELLQPDGTWGPCGVLVKGGE